MPRKDIVKVVLSKEQHLILKRLAQLLGISESEALRMALMDYVKSLNLLTINRVNEGYENLYLNREGKTSYRTVFERQSPQ